MKKFLLLLLLSTAICAQEYTYRNIKKPILTHSEIDQFIVLSSPRTGSTLAYMIFQYLFENQMGDWNDFSKQVVKSHDFVAIEKYCRAHPKAHLIVTVRHPIDSFVSLLKLQKDLSDVSVLSLLEGHIASDNMMLQFYQNFPRERVTLFNYENFHANFPYFFQEIERNFGVQIPNEEKKKMDKFFSKRSVLKVTKNYKSFDQYDPVTGVHGNHISTSDKGLEDLVSPQVAQTVRNRLGPIAKTLGYSN